MPPQSLARTKDLFNAISVEPLWLQGVHNIIRSLYPAGSETETLVQTAATFFLRDLNSVLIEYSILITNRLTDRAKMYRREKLAAKNFDKSLREPGLLTDPVKLEAQGIPHYRNVLSLSGNRVVSQANEATLPESKFLREHGESAPISFPPLFLLLKGLIGQAKGESP